MSETRKLALITGGTDGIGEQVALQLALGYDLILVGRNSSKASTTIEAITAKAPDCQVDFWQYDLSLMHDVDSLSNQLHTKTTHLDAVVLCAGVMLKDRVLTDEGIETVFAVQYLGRYLLLKQINNLLDTTSRVINVSAGGNVNAKLDFDNLNGEKSYDGVQALRQESIANDMLTLDLNEQYPNIKMYCYGPGYVKTSLLRDMPVWFQKVSEFAGLFIGYSAEQAAVDIVTLIRGDYPAGLYDRKAKQNILSDFRINTSNRERLQAISDDMIASARQREQRSTKSLNSGTIESPMRSG